MTLPGPVKVSPIIKLARYAFLITGIIYGASKLRIIKGIAEKEKEKKESSKRKRDAQIAEENKMSSERDLTTIASMFTEERDPAKAEMDPAKAERDPAKAEMDHAKAERDPAKAEMDPAKAEMDHAKAETDPAKAEIMKSKENIIENENNEGFRDVREVKKETSSSPAAEDLGQCKRIDDKNKDDILSGGNDYHVESFSENIPYASPKKNKDDFLPK